MIEAMKVINNEFKTLPDVYYVPIVDGKELNMIAETHDIALILGLGYKHDGRNSQFAKMACRMLNIESAWAE
jgi:hypothetical protein